jgi:hypothetical protein
MATTQYFGTARWGTTQSAAYTGTAASITNAIGSEVYKVRLIVTTAAFVRVDSGSPVAATTDVYMAAGIPEYVTVTPGMKVSAVQVASGGTLYVTECL